MNLSFSSSSFLNSPLLQHPNLHLGLAAGAKQTLQMKISTRKTGLGPSSIQIGKYPTQWSDSSAGLVTQAYIPRSASQKTMSVFLAHVVGWHCKKNPLSLL